MLQNIRWKLTGWRTGIAFWKCEVEFDWIHYAFGILELMGPLVDRRLMEKQIKLITFELRSDTNETSLSKYRRKEENDPPRDHALDDEWKRRKRFLITQADHMRLENDAHFSSWWKRRQTILIHSLLVPFSLSSYASCVRLRPPYH